MSVNRRKRCWFFSIFSVHWRSSVSRLALHTGPTVRVLVILAESRVSVVCDESMLKKLPFSLSAFQTGRDNGLSAISAHGQLFGN